MDTIDSRTNAHTGHCDEPVRLQTAASTPSEQAPPPLSAAGAPSTSAAAELDAVAGLAWRQLGEERNGVLLPTHVRELLARGAPASDYDAVGRAVVRQILALVAAPRLVAHLRQRAAGGLPTPPPPELCLRHVQPADAPSWVFDDEWAPAVVEQGETTLYARTIRVAHAELARLLHAVNARLQRAGGAAHAPYQAALARAREAAAAPPPACGHHTLLYVGAHRGDVDSAREARFDRVEADAEEGSSLVMRVMARARDAGKVTYDSQFVPLCTGRMPYLFASLAEAVVVAAAATARGALNCAAGGLLQIRALQHLVATLPPRPSACRGATLWRSPPPMPRPSR